MLKLHFNFTTDTEAVAQRQHPTRWDRKGSKPGAGQAPTHCCTGAKDPSLCLLTPMFCKPRVPLSLRPSRSLQAHSHDRGKVFPHLRPSPSLLPAAQTVLQSNPISNHSSLKFCWTRSKCPTRAAELPRGGQGESSGGTVPTQVHPTLQGFTLPEGHGSATRGHRLQIIPP